MAARPIAAVALAGIALLTATACGSAHAGPSATYASELTSACSSMRTQIETLGKPGDTPIGKVYPGTVKIGRAFLEHVRRLDPPAGMQPKATAMLREYGYYFDGLALAYALLTKRHSQQGFFQTAAAAVSNLNLAVADARKLGAPGCARQPFE